VLVAEQLGTLTAIAQGRFIRSFQPATLAIGGARKIIEEFLSLAEAGYTDIIVRHITADQSKVLDSTARLADVRRALQGI